MRFIKSLLANILAILIIIPIIFVSYEFVSGKKVDLTEFTTDTSSSISLDSLAQNETFFNLRKNIVTGLGNVAGGVIEKVVDAGADKAKEESAKLVEQEIDSFKESLLTGLTSEKDSTIKDSSSSVTSDNLDQIQLGDGFKIALLADSHESFSNLQQSIKAINSFDKFEFVVHLGDLSRVGEQSQLSESKQELDQIKLSSEVVKNDYIVVPGDHDLWETASNSNFKKVFGKDYQKFETKEYVFLFVNNADTGLGLDFGQEEWLFNEVNKQDTRAWILFMHNPLYSTHSTRIMGEKSAIVKKQAEKILSKIRESEKVIAIVSGDQHYFNIDTDPQRQSLTHVVVGALANDRNLQEPRFAILEILGRTINVIDVKL